MNLPELTVSTVHVRKTAKGFRKAKPTVSPHGTLYLVSLTYEKDLM